VKCTRARNLPQCDAGSGAGQSEAGGRDGRDAAAGGLVQLSADSVEASPSAPPWATISWPGIGSPGWMSTYMLPLMIVEYAASAASCSPLVSSPGRSPNWSASLNASDSSHPPSTVIENGTLTKFSGLIRGSVYGGGASSSISPPPPEGGL